MTTLKILTTNHSSYRKTPEQQGETIQYYREKADKKREEQQRKRDEKLQKQAAGQS